jgi:hypothetical protein
MYQGCTRGHIECLKYAHENGCGWDTLTCSKAAQGGHLDCMKYAHENGCEWDTETCEDAAFKGHLECSKYARENGVRKLVLMQHRVAHYLKLHEKVGHYH